MCGIAGILDFENMGNKRNVVTRITEALSHRGPDATGYLENENIAFGHKRLSIIDLSACSNQPLSDHTKRFHIVFNGEIYNYRELKNKIHEYPFQTQGDAEVVLALYSKLGPICLNSLAGMFAFAIWDDQKKELFAARDRLGVKPLYYYEAANAFLFASEIRALLASDLVPNEINLNAVAGFLQFQSIGHPGSIIKGIYSLEAGSYMIVNHSGLRTYKYWNVVPDEYDFDFGNGTAVKQKINQLLVRSVERRMVSDVPVGAFLSGGIDSSAVVGLMASVSTEPVNTFTVGFNEKEFDESAYAQMVAKKFNTRHQELLLQPTSFLDELIPALDAMDTPSGDGVNSYVVSKAIRDKGITVALSGVGGDELFAGYPIFKQYLQLMKYQKLWQPLKPLRLLLAGLPGTHNTKTDRYRQLLHAKTADIASFYPVFRQIVSPAMLANCTSLPFENLSPGGELLKQQITSISRLPLLSQVSVAEYLGYTQHTLLKDMDQMSMARSLEVREPFFDHELIEFVLNVPDALKYPSYPKKLLVESLGDLLPPEIVHRKKQGFLFPWNDWMKNELRTFCETHLLAISKREFIKGEQLLGYWKRFLNNNTSVRWMEIWLFVVLEYWLQKNNAE